MRACHRVGPDLNSRLEGRLVAKTGSGVFVWAFAGLESNIHHRTRKDPTERAGKPHAIFADYFLIPVMLKSVAFAPGSRHSQSWRERGNSTDAKITPFVRAREIANTRMNTGRVASSSLEMRTKNHPRYFRFIFAMHFILVIAKMKEQSAILPHVDTRRPIRF